MPDVIRNRFPNPSSARESDYQDASRTRPGFGPDEDPLAELARIVGETAQIPHAPTQVQPAQRRVPAEGREPAAPQRDYPRRDTSWRDPQARTTVRAGLTTQTMPGQLEELEAELFSEIRSENLRTLPPAPDLAQLGLPDARMATYEAASNVSAAQTQTRQPPRPGQDASNGQIRANQGNLHLDDEVTLPMHSVLRATPPSARASEDHGMQQPPRFNPAPVQQSTQTAGHDAYGHQSHQDAHEDYDPAGALGAAYYDYDDNDAAYYAASEEHHQPQPAPISVQGPAGNAGYPPIPSPYGAQHELGGIYDDEGEDFAQQHYQPPRVDRRPPPRGTSPFMLGAVALVGVLALGIGSFFTYRAIAGNNGTGANAPLIRADTKPMKEIVAQQPLGASGPNLDVARADGQDKLVTQAEDPVDQIPGKSPVRVVGTGTQTTSLAPVQRVRSVIVRPDGTIVTPDDAGAKPQPVVSPVRTASLQTADAPVVAPPAPVQVAPVQPAPVQPVAVQPVRATPNPALPPLNPVAHVDTVPVVQKPNPAPAVVSAPKPPVAQVQPPVKLAKPVPTLVPHAPAPDTNGPLALDPSSDPAPTQPVRVATASPTASAPAPRASAPLDAGTGDYMVQISSQRSDAEAHHALQAAVQKYGSLGAKGGDVQQADLGARGTYYRARLAGGTHEQALALCTQIKAQGGDCVVAKR